ncbi:MAG: hypothetical protein MI749_19085, partial [Desulfovibrionales bacterium]|nr:hypothetical protein [Desulfovibrionales bacterium]
LVLSANVTLDTGTAGGNITISSTIEDDTNATTRNLILIAGTGSVTLNGTVGATRAIEVLTVTAATLNLNANVTTDDNNVTVTGATVLGADVTVNTGAGGGNISFSSTIEDDTNATTRNLTLIAGTGSVTLNGTVGATRAIETLTVTAATLNLNANVTTDDNNVTVTGATVLGADVTVNTGAGGGNISFSSTIEDDTNATTRNLVLTSGTGSITVTGTIGNTRAIGSLTATGSSFSHNNISTVRNVSITTSGSYTTGGTITTSSTTVGQGNVTFDVAAGQALTIDDVVTTAAGNVTTTDAATLGANITTAGGNISLASLVLSANVTLDTGTAGGNITISSTIEDDTNATTRNLILIAGTGSVTLN